MSIRSLYRVLTAKEAPTNTSNSPYPYRRSNSIIPSRIRSSSAGFRELEDDEDEEEEHYVPRHLRSRKYKDHVSILIMHDHHHIPGRSEEGTSARKGTGFPEPLCGDRNTTLPHPDADTSLNATIEAKDIPPLRVQSRHRLFHGRHQSRTRNKNGTISVEPVGLYDNIQYADGSVENVGLILKERSSKASKHDSVIDVGERVSGETLFEEKEGTESDSDGKSEDGDGKKSRMFRKLHLQKA